MRRPRSTEQRRIALGITTGVVLLLAALAPVAAQTAGGGSAGDMVRTGDSVDVAVGETFDGNLYAFAGTIDIDGTLDGDLVASGGSISIKGTVTGDVIAVGGELTIAGEVQGDVRFAGGQLQVDGPVAGDVAVVGGSAELDGDVGSDVLFGAGQVKIGGDVAGQIYGGAGEYQRTGTVAGPEDVTLGDEDEPTMSDRLTAALYRFLALFLVGAIVLGVLRRPIEAVLTRARQRPAASLLSGLLALAALLTLLVASVVIGILWSILFGVLGFGLLVGTYWFGFVLLWVVAVFTLFLIVVYATPIVVGLTGSRLVLPPPSSIWIQLAALAGGLIIYLLATAIPVAGWFIGAAAVLFATGAIVLAARNFGAPLAPSEPVGT